MGIPYHPKELLHYLLNVIPIDPRVHTLIDNSAIRLHRLQDTKIQPSPHMAQ